MNQDTPKLRATLPPGLNELLQTGTFAKDTVGRSSSAVYKVRGLAGVGDAYLKVMESVEADDASPILFCRAIRLAALSTGVEAEWQIAMQTLPLSCGASSIT